MKGARTGEKNMKFLRLPKDTITPQLKESVSRFRETKTMYNTFFFFSREDEEEPVGAEGRRRSKGTG